MAAAPYGYDGDAEGGGGLLQRDVVEEDALAVAEHLRRDKHALPQFLSPELGDEVAAGHKARDVYRMAEEVVDYGADATFYLSTLLCPVCKSFSKNGAAETPVAIVKLTPVPASGLTASSASANSVSSRRMRPTPFSSWLYSS